jgi:hypothetical protein
LRCHSARVSLKSKEHQKSNAANPECVAKPL